jgi:hypothetical protein
MIAEGKLFCQLPECNEPLPPDRRKFCSDQCAQTNRQRLRRQRNTEAKVYAWTGRDKKARRLIERVADPDRFKHYLAEAERLCAEEEQARGQEMRPYAIRLGFAGENSSRWAAVDYEAEREIIECKLSDEMCRSRWAKRRRSTILPDDKNDERITPTEQLAGFSVYESPDDEAKQSESEYRSARPVGSCYGCESHDGRSVTCSRAGGFSDPKGALWRLSARTPRGRVRPSLDAVSRLRLVDRAEGNEMPEVCYQCQRFTTDCQRIGGHGPDVAELRLADRDDSTATSTFWNPVTVHDIIRM